MPKVNVELNCLKELLKNDFNENAEKKLKEIDAKDKEQDVRLTDVTNRVVVLENRPDNDNQTLALDGNTLSISNGNSVTLPNSASSAISAYSLNGEGSMVDPFIKGESSTLYPEASVGKLEGLFDNEGDLHLRAKSPNGDTKWVSIPQSIVSQIGLSRVYDQINDLDSKVDKTKEELTSKINNLAVPSTPVDYSHNLSYVRKGVYNGDNCAYFNLPEALVSEGSLIFLNFAGESTQCYVSTVRASDYNAGSAIIESPNIDGGIKIKLNKKVSFIGVEIATLGFVKDIEKVRTPLVIEPDTSYTPTVEHS